MKTLLERDGFGLFLRITRLMWKLKCFQNIFRFPWTTTSKLCGFNKKLLLKLLQRRADYFEDLDIFSAINICLVSCLLLFTLKLGQRITQFFESIVEMYAQG